LILIFGFGISLVTIDRLSLQVTSRDRFIAASAIFYELTLATVDQNLVSCSWLPTMS
jgi:PIN domain nuclease of toxin-antitoxin system